SCVQQHPGASEPPPTAATPPPVTTPPPAPSTTLVVTARTTSPRSHRLELGMGAAGIAAAGVGTWLALSARSDADALWLRCGSACGDNAVGDVRTRSDVGITLATGGGALAVGAVVLWWLRRGDDPGAATVSIEPTHGGLVIAGVFRCR